MNKTPDFMLHTGDSLEILKGLPDNYFDSIVTDPPYGLSFMGKKWDYDVPTTELWAECLRVLKPGGHLLAFAGTRTQHRMAVRIEDAGFEIRDMIAWVYGSGFPKSLDVSKAIDKAAGAEREVVGRKKTPSGQDYPSSSYDKNSELFSRSNGENTAPATVEAQQWDGWGTALKPALEPITVARKPLVGTVANNVLLYGTGAINVGKCRVGDEVLKSVDRKDRNVNIGTFEQKDSFTPEREGRWPANFIHDGSQEVDEILGKQARFFYCPKASSKDRGENNTHPTVKPTDLMRYLCRLVTRPGGLVLDPFMGSGSTGKAAMLEGFDFVGIDLDPEHVKIAQARIQQIREKHEHI